MRRSYLVNIGFKRWLPVLIPFTYNSNNPPTAIYALAFVMVLLTLMIFLKLAAFFSCTSCPSVIQAPCHWLMLIMPISKEEMALVYSTPLSSHIFIPQ